MVSLGQAVLTEELAELRRKTFCVVQEMARAAYPDSIVEPLPSGKDLDQVILEVQKKARKNGLKSFWAERARIIAKGAVLEQWRRGQKNLFGKLKNISTRGHQPSKDGHLRLVNLPEDWSRRLTDADVDQLQALADSMDFATTMAFFRNLQVGTAEIEQHLAEALLSVVNAVNNRFSCPVWKSDEAVLQLFLDYRCFEGGNKALGQACAVLQGGLKCKTSATTRLSITSHEQGGPVVPLTFHLSEAQSKTYADRDDQELSKLVLEIGPESVETRGIITRPDLKQSPVGKDVVLGEDFGFSKTSSLVVVRSNEAITQDAVDFATSRPGKTKTRKYLETHVSSDDVEVLETRQLCGKNFLDLIKSHSERIDTQRSEIDRQYNRLGRIRREINVIIGQAEDTIVPEEPEIPEGVSETEKKRYQDMHSRFFRLLSGIKKTKQKRRDLYRKIDAIKKNWLGYVSNVKIALAEKYGAVVASEDLSILAIEKNDPDYKGRTFNKMLNNGARGQYNRRSVDKMKWRGIAHIKLPSYYTSSTDWRTAHVDKAQRSGRTFTALDGSRWDADLHAGEMLARWLFLKPKGRPACL